MESFNRYIFTNYLIFYLFRQFNYNILLVLCFKFLIYKMFCYSMCFKMKGIIFTLSINTGIRLLFKILYTKNFRIGLYIKILLSVILVTCFFLILNVFMYLRSLIQLFNRMLYYILMRIIKSFYTKYSIIEQKICATLFKKVLKLPWFKVFRL